MESESEKLRNSIYSKDANKYKDIKEFVKDVENSIALKWNPSIDIKEAKRKNFLSRYFCCYSKYK
jgi:uncharacterized protein YaaR (DUF327 family)